MGGRVQLRSSVGSAAHLAPMALRKSSFAQTSFTVRSETELSAAVNSIQMALKDGQKPIVIGLAADLNAYIDPQKEKADCIIQVLPTEMAKDDKKHLKVEMIQVKGVKNFKPTYILDADGEMTWTPSGIDTKDGPGLKVFQRQTKWAGKDAVVVGMDGKYNNIKEMTKVEAAFADASTKSAGEATEKMCGYEGQPGSNDGTGFFQTITALKCREIYEALSGA